jgi:hypothetical protein
MSDDKKLRNTTSDRIAALDASEQAKPKSKKKKAPTKARAEAVGVGDSALQRRKNTARIVTGLRKSFEAATRAGNTKGANDLRGRIKAVIAAGE